MGLKQFYQMRRPAQVYPLIMPLIDGPDTPSFPSSHSLQAHLITGVLKLALTPAVLPVWPPTAPPPPPCANTAQALDVLADRIAYNREVAGVTTTWTACGQWAALRTCSSCATRQRDLPGPGRRRPAELRIFLALGHALRGNRCFSSPTRRRPSTSPIRSSSASPLRD
jgi:hypothetical protein